MIHGMRASVVAVSAMLIAGVAHAATFTQLSVTADGAGGGGQQDTPIQFTVAVDANPLENDKPWLDILTITLGPGTGATNDDLFVTPAYTFGSFDAVFGGSGNPVSSFTGVGTNTLTLDFFDLRFDAGETLVFTSTIKGVCTNAAGESCQPHSKPNSGGALANVGASMSGLFRIGEKSFTLAADFEKITNTQSMAVAAVPVPAGLPLLLAGIGGLGLMARRKRKAA